MIDQVELKIGVNAVTREDLNQTFYIGVYSNQKSAFELSWKSYEDPMAFRVFDAD